MSVEILHQMAKDLFQMGFIQQFELDARLNQNQIDSTSARLAATFQNELSVEAFAMPGSTSNTSSFNTCDDTNKFNVHRIKPFMNHKCETGCVTISCSRCSSSVPTCSQEDHQSVCFVAFEIDNEILKHCPMFSEGCNEMINRKTYSDHINNCKFAKTMCHCVGDNGPCGQFFTRNELEKHMLTGHSSQTNIGSFKMPEN